MAIKTNFIIKTAGADIGVYSADQATKVTAVRKTFAPTMDGKNFVAQAYEHMKTCDEFKNGEDC